MSNTKQEIKTNDELIVKLQEDLVKVKREIAKAKNKESIIISKLNKIFNENIWEDGKGY